MRVVRRGVRPARVSGGSPARLSRVTGAALACGLALAAAGCLAPGFAGPARHLRFNTSAGRFAGTLPPLPRLPTPQESETYAALRAHETPEVLLRAALLAGGVTEPKDVARYEAAARARFERLRPLVERAEGPAARARALLEALHAQVFSAYALDQTYLHVLLDEGVYNCVSASLLFNVYAGWLGFPSGVSLLPSHARSFVDVGGRRVEVETTIATGFDPALTPSQMQAFLQLRALGGEFREQPSFKPNATLVALVISNRIAFTHDGVAGESPDEAVRLSGVMLALGARATALDPDDRIAWHNQVARLDRLALLVVAHNRFDDGAALQRIVARLTGDHGEAAEHLRNNVAWAAQRRIRLAKGDAAEIARALADAKPLIDCERRATLCKKLDDLAHQRANAR